MVAVVVLATRHNRELSSRTPTALHSVHNATILSHLLRTLQAAQPSRLHVVGSPDFVEGAGSIAMETVNWIHLDTTEQTIPEICKEVSKDPNIPSVLLVSAELPLLSSETLKSALDLSANALMKASSDEGATVAILGGPTHAIADLLKSIHQKHPCSELTLELLAQVASEHNGEIQSLETVDPLELMTIRTRAQLAQAEKILGRRKIDKLMSNGTTIRDPDRCDIRADMNTGIDCTIDVNVVCEGIVTLGNGVSIGPGCVLRNIEVDDDVHINAYSVLDSAKVGKRCSIGPFAHIRPGSTLDEGVRVGNFVEVKASHLHSCSKANHLAYIGNAEIGSNTNFAAGAITCNFDGCNKHPTVIGDDVFVGTNSTLIAPLNVASGAFIAAGSTITKNITDAELVVARSRQRSISHWISPSKRES